MMISREEAEERGLNGARGCMTAVLFGTLFWLIGVIIVFGIFSLVL